MKPTQNVPGIANHTADYGNADFRRSVFAKDSASQNVPENLKSQTRTSQIINPCDSQLQNQKYDISHYGHSGSKKKLETRPGLLGSRGDLGSAGLSRSAEKHNTKVNYPLI